MFGAYNSTVSVITASPWIFFKSIQEKNAQFCILDKLLQRG